MTELTRALKYRAASSVDRYLVYLNGEPFIPLLLASYWCLVLKLQLGSFAHSPLLVPPLGMDSPWKSVSCLKIMREHFAGCWRLICIAVVGLGAPLSRFLEGAPYKFLNEWMNNASAVCSQRVCVSPEPYAWCCNWNYINVNNVSCFYNAII